MRLREPLQNIGQHAFAEIVGRTEPHHARDIRDDEFRHGLTIDGKHTPRIAKQHFTVGRQCHGTRIAREDRATEDVFQFLDLHGDRRRRAEHGVGRGGEASRLGDGNEGAQHIEIEQRQGMIEGCGHRICSSIFLNKSIISFRLIEHQSWRIVNLRVGN
jgi:hypothetical protein